MLTSHQQTMREWETMTFADNLRRLRIEQFLSQAELARRAGRHALTITRLEAGTTAPSTRTVRPVADALGVQPHDLATPLEVAELRRVLGQAGPKGDRPTVHASPDPATPQDALSSRLTAPSSREHLSRYELGLVGPSPSGAVSRDTEGDDGAERTG